MRTERTPLMRDVRRTIIGSLGGVDLIHFRTYTTENSPLFHLAFDPEEDGFLLGRVLSGPTLPGVRTSSKAPIFCCRKKNV